MEEVDDYTGLPVDRCGYLKVDDIEITIDEMRHDCCCVEQEEEPEAPPVVEKRCGGDRRCSHRRVTENQRGLRYNEGKLKLSMLLDAPHAVEGVVNVMEYGCRKYTRNNWKKGLNHTEIIDSLLRHTSAYLKGEDADQESGLLHVDHIATNAVFLAELVRIKPEFDDRKKGK